MTVIPAAEAGGADSFVYVFDVLGSL